MIDYKNVTITQIINGSGLNGLDGNAFSIMARVKEAINEAGAPDVDTSKYIAQATTSDYENLIEVSRNWLLKYGYQDY